MITLHYSPTPNSQKITIALEEMGLPYEIVWYDIMKGDQLTPEFGKINPNHRVPAIVDSDPAFGGGPHTVFESGAILQYLAEKTGKLLPEDPRQRSVAIQWLTWQVAGFGPMAGQAGHFIRYARVKCDYSIERYSREALRLLSVLERRLSEVPYLAGDEYSIADIACWAIWTYAPQGLMGPVDVSQFPASQRWHASIEERPAVMRGMREELSLPPNYRQLNAKLSDEEWSNLFGDNLLAAVKPA